MNVHHNARLTPLGRERLVEMILSGRVYEVAPLFEVSVSYIYKALARRWLHGIETSLPKTGRAERKLDCHLDALAAYISVHPGNACRAHRVVGPRTWRDHVRRHHVGYTAGARLVA